MKLHYISKHVWWHPKKSTLHGENGLAGVYIIFMCLIKCIDLGMRKNHLNEAILVCILNLCLEYEQEKDFKFSSEKMPFLESWTTVSYCIDAILELAAYNVWYYI